MLERKYKSDNSFVFVIVTRGTNSPNSRAARRTLPSLEQHNYVLPPVPSNVNKGNNEYTWNSLHKVAFNGYSGASLLLSLAKNHEGSRNNKYSTALYLM